MEGSKMEEKEILNGYLSEAKLDFIRASSEEAKKYFYNDYIKVLGEQIELLSRSDQFQVEAWMPKKVRFYKEELKSFRDEFGALYGD